MNSMNKHVERVVAALVIVIIGLIMVIVHLAGSNKPDLRTASPAALSPKVISPAASHSASVPQTVSASLSVPTAPLASPIHAQTARAKNTADTSEISGSLGSGSPARLTEGDLAGKTGTDLRLMRNELYARHGYRFHTPSLLTYFEAKPWYHPDTSDMQAVEKRMSSVETANAAFIAHMERRGGFPEQEAIAPPLRRRTPTLPLLPRRLLPPPVFRSGSTPRPAFITIQGSAGMATRRRASIWARTMQSRRDIEPPEMVSDRLSVCRCTAGHARTGQSSPAAAGRNL